MVTIFMFLFFIIYLAVFSYIRIKKYFKYLKFPHRETWLMAASVFILFMLIYEVLSFSLGSYMYFTAGLMTSCLLLLYIIHQLKFNKILEKILILILYSMMVILPILLGVLYEIDTSNQTVLYSYEEYTPLSAIIPILYSPFVLISTFLLFKTIIFKIRNRLPFIFYFIFIAFQQLISFGIMENINSIVLTLTTIPIYVSIAFRDHYKVKKYGYIE